jgi:predicted extracellular nuclease
LAGNSVQYTSATGTGLFGNDAGLRTELPDVTLNPGQHYLIQEASQAAVGAPLPTADLVDATPINMSATSGKVVYVTGATGLGCNGSTTLCSAEQLARIVDLVGYGAAHFFETAPAPGLSNTTAGIRAGDGAIDTDNNANDFTAGAPTPSNSGGDPDPDPDPEEPCDVEGEDLTPINDVQGDGGSTPIAGESIVTRGVVTADFTSGGASGIPANQGLRGFFMEATAEDRDDDPLTSEGIFVFDGGGIFDGQIGDLVHVAGTAGEFSSVTQITVTELDVCDDTGIELPLPAELPLPTAPADRATVLEPLESMRVTHDELTVIEFFQLERFGEIRLSTNGVLQTPTNVHLPGSDDAGQLAADNAAANIILDDGRTGQNLNRLDSPDLLPYVHVGETLRIGDQLLEHTFVLHFGFGAWRFQPIDIDAITEELADNRTRPRPEDPPGVGGTLKVASFNVLNYFDGDGLGGGFPTTRGAVTPSELARQTEKLVDAIIRLDADVYGLIEIENDGGEFQATRTLVDALNAELGREVYRFVDTGVIGTDEIKQAFVYNRWTVRPVAEWAILTSAVDPRFDDDLSRPALAQTFLRLGSGERVTVVVNHLKSKSQSGLTDPTDPNFDQGDGQGFWNAARTEAAEALADWLATNPTGVQTLGSLIIGDLNAYGREDPIRALEDAGYEDQLTRFTEGVPYTFTFDGMQGTLDTALALDDLATRVTGASVWHINADEVPAIDYQESVGVSFNQRFRTPEIAVAYYDSSAFRSSDHDPVLIGLDLGRSGHAGP